MAELKRPYGVKTATGGVRLYLSYNPDFITWLKDTVPVFARSFDAEEKSWYVGAEYASQVTARAMLSFAGFKMAPTKGQEKREEWFRQNYRQPPIYGASSSGPYAKLYITPEAPPEVIKAAYKALARLYHPDGGTGNTSKMQELNAAYDILRKERKL